MTQIKCPNCGTANATNCRECLGCGMPFSYLPKTAFVDTEHEHAAPFENDRYYSSPPYYQPSSFAPPPDVEKGRTTFMWYRVYAGAMALFYLAVVGIGITLASVQPATNRHDAGEMLVMGIIYAVVGAVFFALHAAPVFLPAKPYNWIVGIVVIGFGMTSCCLWPATIPLLIFWVKPEIRAVLGRN